jgi:type I restriction enzyme R subunit
VPKGPDIFDLGMEKEYFMIFDLCANFNFFIEFPDGIKSNNSVPKNI